MRLVRPAVALLLWLGLACFCVAPGAAGERRVVRVDSDPTKLWVFPPARPQSREVAFDSSAAETVSIGYLSTSQDPDKVGVGGKWDFDTETAGTDSTQGWMFMRAPQDRDQAYYPTPRSRSFWYLDYGNNINAGNHELWRSRLAARRSFRRTGLAGVWHVDDMAGIAGSTPLSGSRSAWCGLRLNGDTHVADELTGNFINSDQQYSDFQGTGAVRSVFPGYANQWDQMMYRDFPTTGSPIPLTFRFRMNLSRVGPTTSDTGGTGWFTPDPTDTLNLVINPIDSLEVWVGVPRPDGPGSGVYDRARKWLSEVLRFDLPGSGQPVELFSAYGKVPLPVRPDTSISPIEIPDFSAVSDSVRVVFRVKTNRTDSDLIGPLVPGGFNSIDGAVLVDDVLVGTTLSDFEDGLAIRPRALLGPAGEETLIDPGTTWIATGRPPPHYGHVHSLSTLPYEGLPGDCNMEGNVLLNADHDVGHRYRRESQNWAVSPTIYLTGPRSALQGIPPTMRSEADQLNMEHDFYSGYDSQEISGILSSYGVRFAGTGDPTLLQPGFPAVSAWSPVNFPGGGFLFGSTFCALTHADVFQGQIPIAKVDSLQIAVMTQTRCARFGSADCGNARGHYWDNIRAQFIRSTPFTGVEGGSTLDFVRGAYPNPSRDGSATIEFELRRAVPVILRFYDLRGALVHEATVQGAPGGNRYRWDGTTKAGGSRLAAGIYFYRLFATGVEFHDNGQRVVFLGGGP